MSVNNQWNLLREGKADMGLALMQKSFEENPTPSTLVTLGLGFLWSGNYEAARKLFQDWTDKYRVTADVYFALTGVAQWCLGDLDAALEAWNLGSNAQYVDMAGGIQSPLLLWVSSVLRPSDKMRKNVMRILRHKTKSPKIRHWPGPLAQFVLHEIDEKSLLDHSIERLTQRTTPRVKWQIAFYRSVLELERKDLDTEHFQMAVRELVDTSSLEWSEDENFLQLVRNPEFYIARYEASKGPVPSDKLTNYA